MGNAMKRLSDKSLVTAKFSRGKSKDGANHKVKYTGYFQNTSTNKR